MRDGGGTDARVGGGGGRRRAGFLLAALVVAAWTTFSHDLGTTLARDYFTWAQGAGVLADEGGTPGFLAAELLLALVFGGLAVAVIGASLRRARGPWPARLLPWALWAVFLYVVWKCLIVYASELVHFVQYALIAALLCAGLGGAPRARTAFLLAVVLGVLDEAWQHWGLALWIQENRRHGFDWSDVILNATGACGGALLFVRGEDDGRRQEPTLSDGRLLAVVAAASALLLPLLLLGRVTLARLFGSYTYHRTWNELENRKPVHWMTPEDGIPFALAAVLLLGLLLGGRRRFLSVGAALALLVLVAIGIRPPSRAAGREVHEVVPSARVPPVEPGEIVVDGVPDEPAWQRAERLGPFVHSITGRDRLPDGSELLPTYARLLWDRDAIYVAFEAVDGDVWARATFRDDTTLPGDEVVEVFLDPDGDEVTYYEFEVSPANVQYDLFNIRPEPPTDYNPSAPFLGHPTWDARGMTSAVAVRGTLALVPPFPPELPLDRDEGLTVEIRIPWTTFHTTTTPARLSMVNLPPRPGDRWRLALYRVERPRVDPADGRPLEPGDATRHAQLQAWSPTFMDSFHRAERFGVIEFDGPR